MTATVTFVARDLHRGVHKDLRPLVRAALEAGWVVIARNRHIKMTNADGTAVVVIPLSPKNLYRTVRNTRRDFRKAGLDL